MQTLSELLATFPDPPKTLLNSDAHSGHGAHSSHGGSGSTSGNLGAAPGGVIMGGGIDMGIGLNRTLTPNASSSSITAGGGSAVATGYQEADLTLLERSTREELDVSTQRQVFAKLMSEPVLIVERALDLAYTNTRNALMKDLAAVKKKKIEKLEKESPCSSAVYTNKHFLDFGNHLASGQEVTDTLDLTNHTATKVKFRVVFPPDTPMDTETYSLSVTPQDGLIKKKDVAHIQFKLRAKQPGQLGVVVIIAVEGGLKFHALVKQSIYPQ